MTRISGERFKNERLYSDASTIKISLVPAIKLVPDLRRLPTMAVGFLLAPTRNSAIIAVVVVFPCVPATATVRIPREIIPSASGYESTCTPFSLAIRSSGLSLDIAGEDTTRRHCAD